MERYFFHLRKDDQLIVDEEGSEYENREIAQKAGYADAREFIANQIRAGQSVLPWSLEITASDGSLIEKISFTDFGLSLFFRTDG